MRQYYDQHIASDYFRQKVRPLIFRRCRGECQRCGTQLYGRSYSIHHVSYSAFGRELLAPWTCVLFCHRCHRIIHGLPAMTDHEYIADSMLKGTDIVFACDYDRAERFDDQLGDWFHSNGWHVSFDDRRQLLTISKVTA